MIRLAAASFDAATELAQFTAAAADAGAGAIASFTGLVRGEGEAISAIELDYHPQLTERSLEAIEAEARARFNLIDLLIIHRHGRVERGEPIVFVTTAALHRRAAFDAVDYAMDRLKLDALLWKKERRADGDRWIEVRGEDQVMAQRWEQPA